MFQSISYTSYITEALSTRLEAFRAGPEWTRVEGHVMHPEDLVESHWVSKRAGDCSRGSDPCP